MTGMFTRALLVPLAATALAACNQGGVALTNATPEEVADAAKKAGGAAATLRPGQWETTVEVVDANVEGMPPEMKKQMLEGPDRFQKNSFCITPEQAANPNGDLLLGKTNENCTYTKFSMAGGRLDGTITCKSRDGLSTMTVTTSATYTAESMEGTSSMKSPEMSMDSRITSRRVGECTDAAPATGG